MAKDLGTNDTVTKSLRTLLLLASHESMRVTDLSRELDVAVSTAHRLLTSCGCTTSSSRIWTPAGTGWPGGDQTRAARPRRPKSDGRRHAT